MFSPALPGRRLVLFGAAMVSLLLGCNESVPRTADDSVEDASDSVPDGREQDDGG